MSWLSLLFEGAVSVLLLVMIAYCVKLNRLLGGLRERDAEIENLLVRFKDASDTAEASVTRLKAAAVEVERTVHAAMIQAQTARDELVSLSAREDRHSEATNNPWPAAHTPALHPKDTKPVDADQPAAAGDVYPSDFFDTSAAGAPLPETAQGQARSEVEQELLRAIRSARSGD